MTARIEDWLSRRAAASPAHTALVCDHHEPTFAELDAAVAATARWLHLNGLEPGERIALLAGPGPDLVLMVHAVPRAGGVIVPLDPRLTLAELAVLMIEVGARLLLHDAARSRIAVGLTQRLPGLRSLSTEHVPGACPAPARPQPVDPATPHSIVLTSGTSGRPKGAVLTWANHHRSAVGCARRLKLRHHDRWLACMPLHHIGGLAILLRSVICGFTVVLHSGFDADRVDTGIDAQRITVVSLVPTMLRRLLEARGDRPFPPHLRCVLLGGGPVPPALLAACHRRAVPVAQTYGLTEAASMVACQHLGEDVASTGKPIAGTQVRIGASHGTAAPPGTPGEILVRGATIGPGYGVSDGTIRPAHSNGWLHTGDVGFLDLEGRLHVTGRGDDLIISGGDNVDPAEVEAVLHDHPAVRDACVVGIPHPEWGQAVVAAIVAHGQPDLDQILAHCRQHLAGHKVPKQLRSVGQLSRTAAGKLRRGAVRDTWLALGI